MSKWAHIGRDKDGNLVCETIEEHVAKVSELCQKFTHKLGMAQHGKLAAELHDLGKESAEFQAYITGENGMHTKDYPKKVDHSTIGAKLLGTSTADKAAIALASMCHHTGLKDVANIKERLKRTLPAISSNPVMTVPCTLTNSLSHQRDLFIRMLFSALCDADFIATESFFAPDKSKERSREYDSLHALRDKFNAYIASVNVNGDLNACRNEIRETCIKAADQDRQLFSLSVPTGGGKTLSSMAFALEHAIKHSLDRIIVVMPYTSITEQNAKVLRDIFGNNVLEHHSNYYESNAQDRRLNRLSSENWDAPIIVTTNVQLLESLLANRTSKCRKVHNIGNSVIILDEAQIMPVELLNPIISVLDGLVKHFGCSVVLSTATQPGWPNIQTKEIITDYLHAKMRKVFDRTSVVFDSKPTTLSDIANDMANHEQILTIVDTRKDARELFELLELIKPGSRHLSALMCAKHRSVVIADIKDRLKSDQVVRVVSTQLIEAGVDVDFPSVFRAIAGIPSIVQSAGRCNREGRRNLGIVRVFNYGAKLPGLLGALKSLTDGMLAAGPVNVFDNATVSSFYKQLYMSRNCDKHNIQKERASGNFETVASAFRMIDDGWTVSVICPYGDYKKIVTRAENEFNTNGFVYNDTTRQLQRYSVTINEKAFEQLKANGKLQTIGVINVVTDETLYDARLGLRV
jgi:CRISPR-associated endonuclease/helicase Cas3